MKKTGNRKRLCVLAAMALAASAAVCGAGSGRTVYAEEAAVITANTVEHVLEMPGSVTGEAITLENEPEVEIGSGMVSEGAEYTDYEYIAPRDGNYCFKFSNVGDDSKISLIVYDSFGNTVCDVGGNGSYSQTVALEGEETYTLRVSRNDGCDTEFALSVIPQREAADLSAVSQVSDKIIFSDQKNKYTFKPETEGYYYFELTDTTAQASYSFLMWDSYDTNIAEGTGRIELDAGEEYQIQVRQNEGLGKYTLNIYRQKEKTDVTGYTEINDEIEFYGQAVRYQFVAPADGNYKFSLSNLRLNVEPSCKLYDTASGSELLTIGSEGSSIDLTAGQEYTIQVVENNGLGGYTIGILYPEDAQGYLEEFAPDNETAQSGSADEDSASVSQETGSAEIAALQARNAELESELEELQKKYDELVELSGIEIE